MKTDKFKTIRNYLNRIEALEAFIDGNLPAVEWKNEGENEDNEYILKAVKRQIKNLKQRITTIK